MSLGKSESIFLQSNKAVDLGEKLLPVGDEPVDENGFVKHDNDKLSRPELIPVEFRSGMARVLAIGAKKYSDDNWRKCKDQRRYVGAALRHLEAFEIGERDDPETGEHHLLHMACCIMMLHGIDIQE